MTLIFVVFGFIINLENSQNINLDSTLQDFLIRCKHIRRKLGLFTYTREILHRKIAQLFLTPYMILPV